MGLTWSLCSLYVPMKYQRTVVHAHWNWASRCVATIYRKWINPLEKTQNSVLVSKPIDGIVLLLQTLPGQVLGRVLVLLLVFWCVCVCLHVYVCTHMHILIWGFVVCIFFGVFCFVEMGLSLFSQVALKLNMQLSCPVPDNSPASPSPTSIRSIRQPSPTLVLFGQLTF